MWDGAGYWPGGQPRTTDVNPPVMAAPVDPTSTAARIHVRKVRSLAASGVGSAQQQQYDMYGWRSVAERGFPGLGNRVGNCALGTADCSGVSHGTDSTDAAIIEWNI